LFFIYVHILGSKGRKIFSLKHAKKNLKLTNKIGDKDILCTLSHAIDPDYITLETKLIVVCGRQVLTAY
jgi:hypothetical protein